ncbi:MAG: hypothetical protein KGP12_02810 [Actinomycetales bacterium]|nr:hypothetical protein [Actinomycetales bacterium]
MAVAVGPAPLAPATQHSTTLPIPPRSQWNANFGYCGETSFISAGMYYGQYTSQWTARSLASPGLPQVDQDSQLLLGVNDLDAAQRMRLQAVAFDSASQRSTPAYLTWVKSMILRGYPVIIGVYLNVGADEGVDGGDDEYDHIVPVLGVGSQSRLVASDRRYRPSDVIVFSDNSPASESPVYHQRFGAFQRSRQQANQAGAPDYSLRSRPRNYATAVTGVLDPDHVTIPVRLSSNAAGEGQQDEVRMAAPPPGSPIELTATVTVPDQGQAYRVYAYDAFAKVPVRDFNAHAADAIDSWTIPAGSGPTWSTTVRIMSDQTRAFRAVPLTAA